MAKRLVEIDDDVLERAREALGTVGIRDTIAAALERAARLDVLDARSLRVHRLGVAAAHATRDALDGAIMRRAHH